MDSDGRPVLPTEVAALTAAYLDLVDAVLPGRIEGLYLVGSLALDDYWPGRSDVDFIAIVDGTLASAELDLLGQLHRQLGRRLRRPPWQRQPQTLIVPGP